MPRLIRSSDVTSMPWKNGGGVTSEISIFPAGASVDTFDWRVSRAVVASSGPFSSFPGIDRTLIVLEGNGLRLEIAGRSAIELDTASLPIAFPGDIATTASLVNGPIVDFNVMTRRSRFAHAVETVMLARGERARGPSTHSTPSTGRHATSILFCARGSIAIDAPLPAVVLGNHDAVLDDRGARFEIEAREASLVLYVTVIPVG